MLRIVDEFQRAVCRRETTSSTARAAATRAAVGHVVLVTCRRVDCRMSSSGRCPCSSRSLRTLTPDLGRRNAPSSDKARRVLGFAPRPGGCHRRRLRTEACSTADRAANLSVGDSVSRYYPERLGNLTPMSILSKTSNALLYGALDALILKTLARGSAPRLRHRPIHRGRRAATPCSSKKGRLYPALYRLERRGWVEAEWGTSELGRRAKLYASPMRAASNSPPKRPPGGGSPPASRKILLST